MTRQQDERPLKVVPDDLKRPKPGDAVIWGGGKEGYKAILVEVRSDGDAIIHLDDKDFGDNDIALQSELFLPRPAGRSGRRRNAFPSASAVAQRCGRDGAEQVAADAAAEIGEAAAAVEAEAETVPEHAPTWAEQQREGRDGAEEPEREPEPEPTKEPPPEPPPEGEALPDQPPTVAVPPTALVFDALRKSAQRQIDRAQRVLDAVDDLQTALEDSGD